jgi:hypothetical protein
MKKYIILALGIFLMTPSMYSQTAVQKWTEDFDGTVSFNPIPNSAWETDINYSTSPPNAYLGSVPNLVGGITTLETSTYDFSAYSYVLLQFNHICKISPQDVVRIEYRMSGQGWRTIPASTYLGKATLYQTRGFSAYSYTEWQANDSLAIPSQSWWKEESFDLSFEVRGDNAVQFRFIIQHGVVPGTQISYGWLLDDVRIVASTYELIPPLVEFIAPLVQGNVYSVGPWEINAKVKTQTSARIISPYLKYIATQNEITIASDSVLMDNVAGDSLWRATIPEFFRETKVTYSITGEDTNGNNTTATSWYHIQPMEGGNYTDYSAAITSLSMNDTVVVMSSNPVSIPIVATIKNVGDSNLTSATIYYSVNGNLPQQYNWTGDLAWDFIRIDTVGHYYPRFNDYDTICVWISMPNGVTDSITHDDTITKYVYGSSDIIMGFYNYLGDTVYSTGRHQIMVTIRTLSGNVVPNASLCVRAKKLGGSEYNDTIALLFDTTQNLWTATLPHYEFGSKVVYSVTETDFLGNSVSIIDSFYIKRITTSMASSSTIYAPWGLGGISANWGVYETDMPTSWTRHVFTAGETGANTQDLLITRIAWNGSDAATNFVGHVRTNFNVYIQITTATTNTDIVYVDPNINRAVLVYKGITISQRGWNEVILDRPFFLPQGSNIILYLEDKTGYVSPPGGRTFWNAGGLGGTKTVGSNNGNAISNFVTPAMRFTSGGWNVINDNHSVALEKINSPASEEVSTNAVPVQVTIRNKGLSNLTSCDINWTLNGTLQQPRHYTGNLLEDFTDTITIGQYIPTYGMPDNLVIWVSNPNNVIDPVNFDDTLSMTTIACSGGGLSGNYTIGSSTSANFTSLETAMSILQTCGMNGKVTFALENGTYPGTVNLYNLMNTVTEKDTFVLTSLSGKAQDVILQTSDVGITLSNNRNIIIQAITVDVRTGNNSAISFFDACTNIVIRDCRLLANPTSTSASSASIYKASGSGIVDSIFIINNLLDGGYYGIYFYGGTGNAIGQHGTNVVFDSNIVSNQYYYGGYLSYVDFISCSHNTVISRTNNTGSSWYALYLSNNNGTVMGNRIMQNSNGVQSYGIYLLYHNYYPNPNPDTALIANNEIILSTTNTSDGIRAESSHCQILHNSIYMSGASTERGIYLSNSANDIVTVKNNNIVMTSSSAYPVYLNGITNLSKYDIDYNNMYAPAYIGYAGGDKASIAEWQQTVTTDIHSTRILPNITNPASSLEPLHDFGLLCDALPIVNQDIQGKTRAGIATIGCYEVTPANGNGMLETITGLEEGYIVGQIDTIKVIIANTGSTSLSSINLGWSVNGVVQNNNLNFPVSLLRGESDMVSLGTLTYSAGKTIIKVWINNLNGGTLADAFAEDDTLVVSGFICNKSYNGRFTIGALGDFQTIEEAYHILTLCGVNGDITLAFESGTHTGNLDLTNAVTIFGNYFLTITSISGNTSDVTFAAPKGVLIQCNNTNNLIIQDIILDATKGTCGIQFTGAASNITLDNCHILTNPTVTVTGYAGIYKATNTGALNGLTVKNCMIDGGYHGIYLYGTSSSYCRNILIDNNTMTKQYYYGIYLYYVSTSSVSFNQITPRSTNAGTTWQALYSNYQRNGGNIIGNRISANNLDITSNLTGMSLNNTDTALVANNEIYFNGNAGTTDGIYTTNLRYVQIINNTVYTIKDGTSGTNRAHYNNIASGYSSVVRNNIFSASGGAPGTTYAFYFNGTAPNYNTYNINYNVDYNDYYSTGTNIGYVAGVNQPDLVAWLTAAAPLDSHSVNILPVFINPDAGLNLARYSDTLLSPRWQDVSMDIRGIARPVITSMGAYTQFMEGQDLMLYQFSAWNDEVIHNQTVPVNVTLFNPGIVPITKATLNWSINSVPGTPVQWTAVSPLDSSQQSTVYMGSFPVSSSTATYDIVVWIDSVNGQLDTVKWNDTIRTSAYTKPLAEFVAPFIPDTIMTLSFDVNTLIRSWTGATIVPPEMTLIATHEAITTYDTVPVTLRNNNIWQAVIPPQYYGTKVIYSLSITDTVGNSITLTDSTYIRNASSIFGDTTLVSLSLTEPLNTTGCMPDYTSVKIALANKGTVDYNFLRDTIVLELEVIDPEQLKYTESIPFTGILQAGKSTIIELMSALPTIHSGAYNIKAWINNPKGSTVYKDTITYTYISGKVSLPIDEDFNDGIPLEFDVWGNNTSATWTLSGADADVAPYFGDSLLSFIGDKGAMSTFATRQMDLNRTTQPSLSFWYFHDTIPCKDYTEVRITIDGGATYTTLLSLTKYNAEYGWQQYSMDLPAYAVNQCVILVFEAMEKSNGDVTQYIDRILITAKQDIKVSAILSSEYSACDLENKELKVVLENGTDLALDYSVTPIIVTLEVKETGEIFKDTLTSDVLLGSAFDTITLATGVNFIKGTYSFKAYFSSILDVDRQNDTLEASIVINPELSVNVHPESALNCLSGELIMHPTISLYNTGNMDLSNINLILQVDTGDNNIAVYALFKETYTGTILAGDTADYTFTNPYTVPWNARHDVRTYAYLSCDSILVNSTNMVTECVDIKDLRIISIDNPSGANDAVGSTVQVATTLNNRSDGDVFNNVSIHVLVTNSRGVQSESFTETLPTVGTSATVSHTFTRTYTVPNDTVYYVTVYTNTYDNYRNNDTMTIRRETVGVGIETLGDANVFTLSQNIPNPANNRTRIDYSIPETGEVVFHVHSVSGQLLYSKTIEAASGKQSLELNTSTFAAGIYFYSIEYKGQRLVKRMMISD